MLRGHVRLALLLALGGLSCLKSDFPSADDKSWKCNEDQVCDPDENQTSCPSDCVWSEATGEGPAAEVCDAQENWTFVEACLETCGNGQEDEGETEETCPRDFPGPTCGNGVCDPHEDAAVCDEDCDAACGDGTCDAGEEVTCSRDCEPCEGDACVCGDMVCGPGEAATCPEDCPSASCGNGAMDEGEACDDGNKIDTDACTNLCTMAFCGDGIVWAGGGEECDDGPDNGDGKPCSANCEANTCGDGDIGPGEACDDGNDVDTDACTNDCQPATCGDGSTWEGEEQCDDGNDVDTDACTNACEDARCGDEIVWAGEEECDDGNLVDADACLNTCLKPRRVIFVTSATFVGNLGGLDGADTKCATAATAAGLTNDATFKAWLSSGGTPAAKRLDTQYLGMYVLTDGTLVAENGWADLTDGELLHAVELTETKVKVNTTPWTNTKSDGTAGLNHCDGWNDGSGDFSGGFGKTNATDATWTDAMGVNSCSGSNPLYCIENP